jgi:hypothetical protein
MAYTQNVVISSAHSQQYLSVGYPANQSSVIDWGVRVIGNPDGRNLYARIGQVELCAAGFFYDSTTYTVLESRSWYGPGIGGFYAQSSLYNLSHAIRIYPAKYAVGLTLQFWIQSPY